MSSLNAPVQNVQDLKEQILALRLRTERQQENMKKHWHDLRESVTPVNLLRQVGSSLSKSGKSTELVRSALGVGVGYTLKNLLFGRSRGFWGKLWRTGAELLIGRLVAKKVTAARCRPLVQHPSQAGHPGYRKAQIILDKSGARFDPPVNLLAHGGRNSSHTPYSPVLFLSAEQR